VISSLAAASDHIEHVRTQLPYALTAGSFAILAFAATGVFLAT
jgi:Na+/H+ antiporter NhaC